MHTVGLKSRRRLAELITKSPVVRKWSSRVTMEPPSKLFLSHSCLRHPNWQCEGWVHMGEDFDEPLEYFQAYTP